MIDDTLLHCFNIREAYRFGILEYDQYRELMANVAKAGDVDGGNSVRDPLVPRNGDRCLSSAGDRSEGVLYLGVRLPDLIDAPTSAQASPAFHPGIEE